MNQQGEISRPAATEEPAQLKNEGFSDAEADAIFGRAAELQSRTEFAGDETMSRATVEASAERAGIKREFIDLAIKQLEEERKEAAATSAARAVQRAGTRRAAGIAAAAAAGVLLLTSISSYGRLNASHSQVEEKRAQLENVLQRRHDLIPQLISLTRRYAPEQKKLIERVGSLQRLSDSSASMEQKHQVETQLSNAMSQVVTDLRHDDQASANPVYARLADEVAGAENRISVERKRYNEAVAAYNRVARSFPVVLVRPVLGFPAQQPLFRAAPEAHTPPRLD